MKLERRIENLNTAIKTNERVLQSYKHPDKSSLNQIIANDKEMLQLLYELKAYRDGCHCDTCKYLDKDIRPCRHCGDNVSRWEYGGGKS